MQYYQLFAEITASGLKSLIIIFGFGVPLLIAVLALIFTNKLKKEAEGVVRNLQIIIDELHEDLRMHQRSVNNLCNVEEVLQRNEADALLEQAHMLSENALACYRNIWTAPPERYFKFQRVYGELYRSLHDPKYMVGLLAIGLGGTAIMSLTGLSIDYQGAEGMSVQVLFPLITAVLAAMYIYRSRIIYKAEIEEAFESFNILLTNNLPVLDNTTGTSQLVEELSGNREKFASSIDDMNKQIARFLDDEFVQVMCQNIKEAMDESFNPVVEQANNTIIDLAAGINKKQEVQMQALVELFLRELKKDMKELTDPLQEQIEKFVEKNEQVTLSMDAAQKGLNDFVSITNESMHELVRASGDMIDQGISANKKINQELSDTNQSIFEARNDLKDDIKQLKDGVSLLGTVATDITAVYTGEKQVLVDSINNMGRSLDDSREMLETCLDKVVATLRDIEELKQETERGNRQSTEALRDACDSFRDSTDELINASGKFTTRSDDTIQRAAESLDKVTADVIERIVFTASALREAVEELAGSVMRPDHDGQQY